MSYMNLPIGRARRLQYSREINTHLERRYNINFLERQAYYEQNRRIERLNNIFERLQIEENIERRYIVNDILERRHVLEDPQYILERRQYSEEPEHILERRQYLEEPEGYNIDEIYQYIEEIHRYIEEIHQYILERQQETPQYIEERRNRLNNNFEIEENIERFLIKNELFEKSKITLNLFDDNFCVICQTDIQKNDIMRILDCSHCFHINCIDKWFTTSTLCPTCKFEFC